MTSMIMSGHAANGMVDWRDLHVAFIDAAMTTAAHREAKGRVAGRSVAEITSKLHRIGGPLETERDYLACQRQTTLPSDTLVIGGSTVAECKRTDCRNEKPRSGRGSTDKFWSYATFEVPTADFARLRHETSAACRLLCPPERRTLWRNFCATKMLRGIASFSERQKVKSSANKSNTCWKRKKQKSSPLNRSR